MKVVAFNGSPRKKGNTYTLIRTVLKEISDAGIETDLIQLGGKNIHGCVACYKCFDNKNRHCAMDDDYLNECIDHMLSADGIIIGSPTYFANLSTEVKALIDRAGLVSKANDNMFRRKAGAAVVAARRAGSVFTFDAINHFFTISQMIIPGSQYWNMGFGLDRGEVTKDEEGLEIMKTLGENMAWLLNKITG
jgi:multimeric flavodoxin WrbA